ncbi:hypothetical protein MTR_7g012310 [Medicago truncatula]|uniref:Uncharacterized protein n=1 Tax=Medicago truncatula TaxID=3880 RepID=G7L457_MEDTR|nr:hypothetical protein MTR_7g012310 [Medicago truncatula]
MDEEEKKKKKNYMDLLLFEMSRKKIFSVEVLEMSGKREEEQREGWIGFGSRAI